MKVAWTGLRARARAIAAEVLEEMRCDAGCATDGIPSALGMIHDEPEGWEQPVGRRAIGAAASALILVRYRRELGLHHETRCGISGASLLRDSLAQL